MPVVLEDTGRLFQPGECPRAALYCGWYSLARYVDAFEWVPGAIGYHIASAECRTLRQGNSQVWCKRMLEEGVAVTIGPVDEPYVQAFPLPEVFFQGADRRDADRGRELPYQRAVSLLENGAGWRSVVSAVSRPLNWTRIYTDCHGSKSNELSGLRPIQAINESVG